jgi:uncharacterized membrane protein
MNPETDVKVHPVILLYKFPRWCSETTQVVLRVLFLGDTVKEAIDARRFHHQLMPMEVNVI